MTTIQLRLQHVATACFLTGSPWGDRGGRGRHDAVQHSPRCSRPSSKEAELLILLWLAGSLAAGDAGPQTRVATGGLFPSRLRARPYLELMPHGGPAAQVH